jgi:hypothetical protein
MKTKDFKFGRAIVELQANEGWVGVVFKFSDHFVPYTQLGFGMPWAKIGKEESGWADMFKVWSIEAPTTLKFSKTDGYWTFMFTMLGFGFCLTRQTGY